jgi:RNA recognition motif-containing protein
LRYGSSGGKRQRESDRDQRKREKAERLRRNRELSARTSGDEIAPMPAPLPEVPLEDVVLGVPDRPKAATVRPTKLFAGGLSWNTTSEDLLAAFSRFGPVMEATVIADRDTGRSRGFGFVTFEQPRDADAAIEQMSGSELDGRTLKVNRAEPR